MGARATQAPSLERLWSAFAADRDRRLRDQIIETCRPLALSVLKQLGVGGDEDLLQVAMLGLVKAVDRFDPASGYQFSTFAVPTITGEIKRYLRDHSRLVRPPRSLSDLHAAMIAKERALTRAWGRAPALSEIAEALGVDTEQLVEVMAIEETCVPCSLDGLLPSLERDQPVALEACLGVEDPELARIETRLAWSQVLDELEWSLRRVIELRYYENLSQKETARLLGVSQMQISRLERRALERLRYYSGELIRSLEGMPAQTERPAAAASLSA